jgi:hypothetical protein
MLFHDGVLIADDGDKVTFDELGPYNDATTGKPVGNVTRYTYTNGDERYVVTFTRHADLAADKFIDDLKGPRSSRPGSSVSTARICGSPANCASTGMPASNSSGATPTTRCGS